MAEATTLNEKIAQLVQDVRIAPPIHLIIRITTICRDSINFDIFWRNGRGSLLKEWVFFSWRLYFVLMYSPTHPLPPKLLLLMNCRIRVFRVAEYMTRPVIILIIWSRREGENIREGNKSMWMSNTQWVTKSVATMIELPNFIEIKDSTPFVYLGI